MNRRLDVLVVGEVLIELAGDEPWHLGQQLRLSASGDALNAAAAAAAAGADVAIATRLGDDELAGLILESAASLGIDTSLMRRVAAPQGIYFQIRDPSGQREFVYARTGSAASTMEPGDLDDVSRPRVVLASGICCAISERARATVVRASQVGEQFVYDPNFRPRLATAERARADLVTLAPAARLVTPSAPAETLALLDTTDAGRAAEQALRLGARSVAVTCGKDGVVLADEGGGVRVLAAIPPPSLIDQTGAGDVFAGTVAARLAGGDDLDGACALGIAAASLSLGGSGGTSRIASLDEVRRLARLHARPTKR